MLGAEIYNCFPFRKNETKYLAVFATEITGNPHAFDQKGSWGTFLYQVIQMELRQRKVFPQKSEIFPAFFRQRCFLAEGILIDDISNYVMLSHVKAQKRMVICIWGWKGSGRRMIWYRFRLQSFQSGTAYFAKIMKCISWKIRPYLQAFAQGTQSRFPVCV